MFRERNRNRLRVNNSQSDAENKIDKDLAVINGINFTVLFSNEGPETEFRPTEYLPVIEGN
jgi:hypothetical protein